MGMNWIETIQGSPCCFVKSIESGDGASGNLLLLKDYALRAFFLEAFMCSRGIKQIFYLDSDVALLFFVVQTDLLERYLLWPR